MFLAITSVLFLTNCMFIFILVSGILLITSLSNQVFTLHNMYTYLSIDLYRRCKVECMLPWCTSELILTN